MTEEVDMERAGLAGCAMVNGDGEGCIPCEEGCLVIVGNTDCVGVNPELDGAGDPAVLIATGMCLG